MIFFFFGTSVPDSIGASGHPAPLPHLGLVMGKGLPAVYGTFALEGQLASFLRGYVLPAEYGTFAVDGIDAALGSEEKVLNAETGYFSLVGQDANVFPTTTTGVSAPAPFPFFSTILQSFAGTLTAETGTFAVVGQTADLRSSRLDSAYGTFALTGYDVTLKAGHLLTAAHGAFALDGQDATLTQDDPGGSEYPAPLPSLASLLRETAGNAFIIAERGIFTFTGQIAGVSKGLTLTAESGTFAMTGANSEDDMEEDLSHGTFGINGQIANLLKGNLGITAAHGTFATIGQLATLESSGVTNYNLPADHGAFAVDGQDINFLISGHSISAAHGIFTMNGQPASFVSDQRGLTAEAGVFALAGKLAGLYLNQGQGSGGGQRTYWG
jgi:hypothetical protein